jgi:hypothetical protein
MEDSRPQGVAGRIDLAAQLLRFMTGQATDQLPFYIYTAAHEDLGFAG